MSDRPVALITGAAKRIGAAIARALHAEGYRVVIHYRHTQRAAQTLCAALNAQRPDSALAVQADLNHLQQVQALADATLQAFARCDVLVNNASAFYPTPLEQASEAQWEELFASNAKAPYFLCQALAAALQQARGCIVNLADIHAERPKPRHAIYCMAKAANMMMTRALALELAPHVRVNGVAPGGALWPEDARGMAVENPALLEAIPMKALGGSASIVETVVFLVTRGHYITGQCINVDGGRTLVQ